MASVAASPASAADERLPRLPEGVTPLKRFADLGQFLEKHSHAVVVYVLTENSPSDQLLDVVDNFSKHGYPIAQQLGADPALAYEALVTWRNSGAEEASKFLQSRQPNANERGVLHALEKGCLKGLVSRRPLMVFMKGEPSRPVCRFSKQLMQLFAENQVQHFGFVNILEDNHLREALKVFSDWPTYPQIYSEGEFVGGVDILKDLAETGQLRSSLAAAAFVGEETPAAAPTTAVES